MNDLTAEKVNAFQNLIQSCGDVVRVQIADVSSIPFLVNLYHPTVNGKNLGELFYRCKEHVGHKVTQERRWNKTVVQMVSFVVLIFYRICLNHTILFPKSSFAKPSCNFSLIKGFVDSIV